MLPPELELPEGVGAGHELPGQSRQTEDGRYDADGLWAETGWPAGAQAFASCYGEAPLVIGLQGRRTTVPCDGQVHPAGRAGPAGVMRLVPRPQGLLSYRIALSRR